MALRYPLLSTSRPGLDRSRPEPRRGMVTVEFALCASIFFLFVFGMLELSRFLYVKHGVQMVAYEAARAGVVPGARSADVESRAANLMAAIGVRNYEIDVEPDVINNLTEHVSVNIVCDFASNSWLPPAFFDQRQITSTISLQHENMAYLRPGDADLASIIGDNHDEPVDQ